jgi:replication factor C subunit 2/4
MKSRVLELNASDERGISIVREKVKNFARTAVSSTTAQQTSTYPCPPYKIIILDEADSMTQDAQSALRRTMETYSKITRFCLICNYVTRIIDPLASRCSKFRFKPLDQGNAMARLVEIAAVEGVQYEDGVVEALVKVSDGDLRRAITYMQSAAKLHNPVRFEADEEGDVDMEGDGDANKGISGEGEAVGEIVMVRSVEEIAGVIPEDVIDRLLKACEPKPGKCSYTTIATVVSDMVADGWNASQTIIQASFYIVYSQQNLILTASQLYNRLVYDDVVSANQKNEIVLIFSEVDKRLADGADEHLQILDLALRISGALSK